MEKTTENIKKYKQGDRTALSELIIQFEPLVRKYAKKTFPLEYEDAKQEYYIIIIQAINKMTIYDQEAQCLKYIVTSVKNRYTSILLKHYSAPDILPEISDPAYVDLNIDDAIFHHDLCRCLEQVRDRKHHKKTILIYSLHDGLSDIQIAEKMGLSRQYVHRVKMSIYKKLLV